MPKFGKVDFKELKQLAKRLDKIDLDKWCQHEASRIANKLMELAKKDTPVGEVPSYATEEAKLEYWKGYKGGTLKENWYVDLVPTKEKGEWRVDVYNPLGYASYVEYGHSQRVGRYVPQIGLTLKKSWVFGSFMLTKNTLKLARSEPKLLEKKIQKELEKVVYGRGHR